MNRNHPSTIIRRVWAVKCVITVGCGWGEAHLTIGVLTARDNGQKLTIPNNVESCRGNGLISRDSRTKSLTTNCISFK